MPRLAIACALAAATLLPQPGVLRAQRPLPDESKFFAETRENLARSNREQYRYAYKERRTELHTNPFGRLGTGEIRLYEVTPGATANVYIRRLLERDGRPVHDSKPERQQRRIRTGRSVTEDAADTLRFAIERRETVNGRDMIVVRFEPRLEAEPETREGRMAKAFRGRIWVDEQAREVVRVEAAAIDDLSYGFGMVARLNEGTAVTLTRARIDDHAWLPTAITFKGQGRALLVRRLNIDYAIEWFDYRRVQAQ